MRAAILSPGSSRFFQTYGDLLALAVVLAIMLGLPAGVLIYQRIVLPARYGDVHVVELAAMAPEAGGWQPDLIRVNQGERVRLRIYGRDVVHGFAIGRLGIRVPTIYPGQVAEVEFVAEEAGEFTYYCDVWCSPNHPRMRGILQVVGPDGQVPVTAPSSEVEAGLAEVAPLLDQPHPADHWPARRPSARRGADLARKVNLDLSSWRDPAHLRRLSPSQVFAALQFQAPDLTDDQRWDLVAFLWRESTSAEALEQGAILYARNCAACHGETGAGDGPGARYLERLKADFSGEASEGAGDAMTGHQQAIPDFTDARHMAGGTGWLYYGKIVRGGMGTGMPYFGPLFTEDELWSVVDYLWTFLFDYR